MMQNVEPNSDACGAIFFLDIASVLTTCLDSWNISLLTWASANDACVWSEPDAVTPVGFLTPEGSRQAIGDMQVAALSAAADEAPTRMIQNVFQTK